LAEGAWSGRELVAPLPAPLRAPERESGPELAPAPLPAPTTDPLESAHPADGPRRSARGLRPRATAAALLLTAGAVTAGLYHAGHVGGQAAADPPSGKPSGFHVDCVGAACDGLNPVTTLCGVEPETLMELLPAQGAGLEVRYQPLCRAAWARTWNDQLGDRLTLSEPGAPTQGVTLTDPHKLDGFTDTPLLALTAAPLRVCLTTSSPPATTCRSVPSPFSEGSPGSGAQ
jgi:hypothetical protein